MWFSCFRILPGSAEAQVIWGGMVKWLLIACFIANISVKKYQNPLMCIRVVASQRWDVFLRHGVYSAGWPSRWASAHILVFKISFQHIGWHYLYVLVFIVVLCAERCGTTLSSVKCWRCGLRNATMTAKHPTGLLQTQRQLSYCYCCYY